MRAHASTSTLRTELAKIGASPSPVRLSLPAHARNIAVVRRALEAVAKELALPRRVIEDMRLAVTEACTNVVRYAYNGAEADAANAMRVQPDEHGMQVVVEDRGRGLGPSPDARGRIAMSFAPTPIGAA